MYVLRDASMYIDVCMYCVVCVTCLYVEYSSSHMHRWHIRTKEYFSSLGILEQFGGRQPKYLHDTGQLFHLVFTGKQRIPYTESMKSDRVTQNLMHTYNYTFHNNQNKKYDSRSHTVQNHAAQETLQMLTSM